MMQETLYYTLPKVITRLLFIDGHSTSAVHSVNYELCAHCAMESVPSGFDFKALIALLFVQLFLQVHLVATNACDMGTLLWLNRETLKKAPTPLHALWQTCKVFCPWAYF